MFHDQELNNIIDEIKPKIRTNEEKIEFNIQEIALVAFKGFFQNFLARQEPKISIVLLQFFEKAKFPFFRQKDEESKFNMKPQFLSLLAILKNQVLVNIDKILANFDSLVNQAKEIKEFYDLVQLEKGFESFFHEKIAKELQILREKSFLLFENEDKLLFCLFFCSFLNQFNKELISRPFFEEEVFKEIFIRERIICQEMFLETFQNVLILTNTTSARLFHSFPFNFHKILQKINKFIYSLETETGKNLFELSFLSQISKTFFEKLEEKEEDPQKFSNLKQFFEINDGQTNEIEDSNIPSDLFSYYHFLKSNIQKKYVYENSIKVEKKKKDRKKNADNIDFDLHMNTKVANLLVLPHLFKEKSMKTLGNKGEKPLKMNQVQQSQTLVSSVLNKEDDYLSRMMEGVIIFLVFE